MKGILTALLSVCSLCITFSVLFFVGKVGPKINEIGEIGLSGFAFTAKQKIAESFEDVLAYSFKPKNDDYEKAYRTSRLLAVRKDPQAFFNLAYMYENGKLIFEDPVKAMHYYQQAADLGFAPAQINLANMYFYGRGVRKDYDKAFKLYEAASKQNDAIGLYNLAVMYYNGYGIKQNYEKAFALFQKAALLGLEYAEYALGLMYYEGKGAEKDYKKSLEHFLKVQNIAPAAHTIGLIYLHGYTGEQNEQKALEYFTKAGKAGYAKSQIYLGLYKDKVNQPDKPKNTGAFPRKTAVLGDARMQATANNTDRNIAENPPAERQSPVKSSQPVSRQEQAKTKQSIVRDANPNNIVRPKTSKEKLAEALSPYHCGDYVWDKSKDDGSKLLMENCGTSVLSYMPSEADFNCFYEIAMQGYARAQWEIGRYYEDRYYTGNNDDENRAAAKRAAEWFYKAAQQGFVSAQASLGILFIVADEKKSAECDYRAAVQNDILAMERLVLAYEYGSGVPKDYEKAYKWISKAETINKYDWNLKSIQKSKQRIYEKLYGRE
jgi:TPR repeat protein